MMRQKVFKATKPIYNMKNRDKIVLNKIYLGLFIFILLSFIQIDLTSATLGTFKKGSCVDLLGSSSDSSMNISTISTPHGTDQTIRIMQKNGVTFNYTFCDTSYMGEYSYNYYDGSGVIWVNNFFVTADGQEYNQFPTPYFFILGGILFTLMFYIFKGDLFRVGASILFMFTGIITLYPGFNYLDYSTFFGLGLGTLLCAIGGWLILTDGRGNIISW